ncbi:VanW family protein, partial [Bacillus subtilis]
MKKIHLTVIILFSILLIGSASYGLLYMYVNQPALPKDVRVGEWSLEGMNRKEVQQALDARLKQLKEWPVTLEVDDPAAKMMTFTAAQTGANYSDDDFRAAVQQLDEGNLWERAYARYHFTKEWS